MRSFAIYDLAGAEPTLVFLPGLGFPSVPSFLTVATHPRLREHRAILVDLLGTGTSDHPATFSYAIEDQTETVAAILDHEGLERCVVVGHSLGGTIAIDLASKRLDLVGNLVVCEANITSGGGAAIRHIASFARSEFVDRIHAESLEEWRQAAIAGDATSSRLLSALEGAAPEGVYESAVTLVNLADSFMDRFSRLPMPCSFVYGEESVPARSDDARPDAPDPTELEARGIRTAVVPNAGHLMMWDNPDGLAGVLSSVIH